LPFFFFSLGFCINVAEGFGYLKSNAVRYSSSGIITAFLITFKFEAHPSLDNLSFMLCTNSNYSYRY
jgi:energy-coupling factor transporter transmembrane protein EcfT